MTKAEKIFNATRFACKKHIEAWGYEINPNGKSIGYNTVITEEPICTRTLNDIEKFLKRARKDIELFVKFDVWTSDRAEEETKILNMVESTIRNARQALKG